MTTGRLAVAVKFLALFLFLLPIIYLIQVALHTRGLGDYVAPASLVLVIADAWFAQHIARRYSPPEDDR